MNNTRSFRKFITKSLISINFDFHFAFVANTFIKDFNFETNNEIVFNLVLQLVYHIHQLNNRKAFSLITAI